jgi:transposase
MQDTSPQNSRKASGVRVERLSNDQPIQVHQVIKLGVDTHAGHYTVARMIDHSGIQPAQKMTPDQFLKFLEKQQTLAKRVVMVYEAGPYGFALFREVTALGIECLVCAPERLSRGRKRVNDKIDATELVSRLDRQLAGNSAALRLVRVPTLQQELSRRRARERNTYRKERQRWIARGRSLLHTLGVARPGRWWEPLVYERLLERIEQQYGAQIAAPIREELDRDREMLGIVEKKRDELTIELCRSAREKGSIRIRGIGELSSELLDREIHDWNRFSNRRQIASYTGLCPGEASSGDSQMTLSIDKHGNPRLRVILVELAWLLIRYQPDYRRLQKWKHLFEKPGSKAQRKKAAVALARHLAVDLWRIKTGRAKPQDLGLKVAA